MTAAKKTLLGVALAGIWGGGGAQAQVNWVTSVNRVGPSPLAVIRGCQAPPIWSQARPIGVCRVAGSRALAGRNRSVAPRGARSAPPGVTYTVAVEQIGPGMVNTWVWRGRVNAAQLVNRGRNRLAQKYVSFVYVRSSDPLTKIVGPTHHTKLRRDDLGRPLYNVGVAGGVPTQ